MAIGKIVFAAHLGLMKRILRLGEFKFGENTAGYRYYREEVMGASHETIRGIFQKLEGEKVIERCECGADGSGWTKCPVCGGSGFKDAIKGVFDKE